MALHLSRRWALHAATRPRPLAQAPLAPRRIHVRAISFSTLGRAALRGLRLPVFAGTAALGTAAGTLAMANRTADREYEVDHLTEAAR